jgi:protoporphyrinogen oxidase
VTANGSGPDPEDWVIIGGGAGGGWLGLRGVERGHRVTIVEQRPGLGGLTRSDELLINETAVTVDSFYHVILESDRRLLGLLDELDLENRIRWSQAPAQIIASGVGYPATSFGEMARLPALKLLDRIRIAASVVLTLGLPRRLARSLTAERWLRIAAGSSALEAFWRPMLRAKLGTRSGEVAASFMVATFRRLVRARLSGAGDRFGVMPGGYRPVFEALTDRFTSAGGRIRTDAGVSRVHSEPGSGGLPRVVCTLSDGTPLTADRVWVTTPGPAVLSLLPQLTPQEQHQVSAAPYLGVVCATVALDKAPNDAYITYLVDDLGLTGVIGMHALLPPEQTGGAALVYLPRYCAPDDPWFDETDEVLQQRFVERLAQAFPEQRPTVLAIKVNRARHVVPLPLPGAADPLPHTTSIPGVHVVSAVQNVSGTLNVETTLELASRALAEIEGDR